MNVLISVSRLFRSLSSDSIQGPRRQAAGQWQEGEIIEFWMERVDNDGLAERAPAEVVGSEFEHQSFAQ